MIDARTAHFAMRDALCALLDRYPPHQWLRDVVMSLPYQPLDPRSLPVASQLSPLMSLANAETQSLVDTIVEAAPTLCWQQSYTQAQVGADHLARYGWFNLISPEGIFLSDDLRLSVGIWGQGLTYPRHWHAPRETYVVLAGNAEFHTEGRAPVRVHAGGTVDHPSNIPHGMIFDQAPLMALAIWQGDGLLTPSTLEGAMP